MKTKAVIYKVTNSINKKIYIGSTTKDSDIRWNHHIYFAKNGKGYAFHDAMRKHGIKNFKKEIICTVLDINKLDEIEDYFIKYYDCINPKGYNSVGVQKGTRKLIKEKMLAEWANVDIRSDRIKKMTEGSRHRFEPIVSVHTQTGEVKHYESVHAAMRDGVAQSAIYFCINTRPDGIKDKTGQKRCWFRKEDGLMDEDYKNKALALIGKFKTDFTIPILATNIQTNIITEFKDVYECAKFLNLKVKNIRRHIKGDKGYCNHVKGYIFKYK